MPSLGHGFGLAGNPRASGPTDHHGREPRSRSAHFGIVATPREHMQRGPVSRLAVCARSTPGLTHAATTNTALSDTARRSGRARQRPLPRPRRALERTSDRGRPRAMRRGRPAGLMRAGGALHSEVKRDDDRDEDPRHPPQRARVHRTMPVHGRDYVVAERRAPGGACGRRHAAARASLRAHRARRSVTSRGAAAIDSCRTPPTSNGSRATHGLVGREGGAPADHVDVRSQRRGRGPALCASRCRPRHGSLGRRPAVCVSRAPQTHSAPDCSEADGRFLGWRAREDSNF